MKKAFLILLFLIISKQASATGEAFVVGCKSLDQGDFDGAIQCFQKSIDEPGFSLPDYAKYLLAKSYFEKNNYASAEAYAQDALAQENRVLAPDLYILCGRSRINLGDNKKAAGAFLELLKKYPDNRLAGQANYYLAEAYYKEKKFKDAFKYYSAVDLYYPLSSTAKNSRARMAELKKKYGYSTPLSSAKELYQKGKKYWDDNDYAGAAAMFNQLAKKYPRSKYVKSALYMTGLAELETSDYTAAINTLEKNIREKGPQWQNSYYYLGRAFGRRGNYQKGIDTLQYFISLYPGSPLADNAYYYIGYYQEIEKDFASAVNAYAKLLEKHPLSALSDTAVSRVGRIYYQLNDKESARRYFAQVAKYPVGLDTPMCIYWWAKLSEEKNKSEAASLYSYLIQNFDHTYYAYRADERLRGMGYASSLKKDSSGNLNQFSEENLSPRVKLLIEAGLTDYAKFEAGIEDSESYQTTLGLLLQRQGEYYYPIYLAEKKVKGAILRGESNKLPKDIWKLAYPKGFWNSVQQESANYKVDPYLILALIREESRFNPRAVSRSYARGLMQIISPTAKRICKQLGIGYYQRKLYEPSTNIKMGTFYLDSLIQRFDGNIALALAGYNGGPVRVKKWIGERYNGRTSGIDVDDFVINIPIKETRDYVEKVLGSYYQYKRIYD